jgi:16S rRNA (cytosine1402-N4)-methyltransferase
MPAPALREKQHPAKRSFQALRIAVNGELQAAERSMMRDAVDLCAPGGQAWRSSAFHSLEDRIVKNVDAEAAAGLHVPAGVSRCASAARSPR